MEKKYCRDCGSPLAEHPISYWDEQTGEQKKGQHCTNLLCVSGCSHAGHQFRFPFMNKCRRCKYEYMDFMG